MRDKDTTPIEAIDFETRQPSTEPNRDSKTRLSKSAFLWLAFLLLIITAFVVFSFLPKYVADQQNHASKESQEVFDPPPASELEDENDTPSEEVTQADVIKRTPEELSALKSEAEELLLQLIEKQKVLETKAVKKWADQEFKIALELGSNGDEHFRKQEYSLAIASYKDAVMVLNDLENKVEPTLMHHLEKGELALNQVEKDTAEFHFELAKEIDADNLQAKNGLQRAKTINELYRLLEQGGKLEAASRFADAKKIYKEATILDPLSKDAKTAFARVADRLANNEFNHYMKKGYAALGQRQYGDARAAFSAAQKLSPGSTKPKQGIIEIEQALRSEKITSLTTEAQHFEANQDWKNAASSYQEILLLKENSQLAQQGLNRSSQRADLLDKLDTHIENKLRLSSDSVSNNAQQVLAKVAELTDPGSKIAQRASTLKSLIEQANRPVHITLQSDNLTDIVIFKVGKFGKFEQRKIELKSGKYTIVGSRPGYRDVRKTVTISTNTPNEPILVRCEEAI